MTRILLVVFLIFPLSATAVTPALVGSAFKGSGGGTTTATTTTHTTGSSQAPTRTCIVTNRSRIHTSTCPTRITFTGTEAQANIYPPPCFRHTLATHVRPEVQVPH